MQSIKDWSLTTWLFISIFQKSLFSSINRSKTFSFYNSWRITSTLREQNYFWVVRKTSKWRCYKVYTQAHFQLARLNTSISCKTQISRCFCGHVQHIWDCPLYWAQSCNLLFYRKLQLFRLSISSRGEDNDSNIWQEGKTIFWWVTTWLVDKLM